MLWEQDKCQCHLCFLFKVTFQNKTTLDRGEWQISQVFSFYFFKGFERGKWWREHLPQALLVLLLQWERQHPRSLGPQQSLLPTRQTWCIFATVLIPCHLCRMPGLGPLGGNANAKVSWYVWRLRFHWALSQLTPDLVRLTSKQNYPWKEKNRPEFLEKNQQPKDKMQTENLMVHSYINGNLTKAAFCILFLLPQQLSLLLPSNLQLACPSPYCKHCYKEGIGVGGGTLFHKKVTTFDQCPNWTLVKFIISLTMKAFQN